MHRPGKIFLSDVLLSLLPCFFVCWFPVGTLLTLGFSSLYRVVYVASSKVFCVASPRVRKRYWIQWLAMPGSVAATLVDHVLTILSIPKPTMRWTPVQLLLISFLLSAGFADLRLSPPRNQPKALQRIQQESRRWRQHKFLRRIQQESRHRRQLKALR
jgi:hypothetical protein